MSAPTSLEKNLHEQHHSEMWNISTNLTCCRHFETLPQTQL
jgi:hypothetical protein